MADEQNIHSLQTQFPDMSQSVIGDVLKTYKGNKDAAAAALGGIDEQTREEQKRKIGELKSMFPIATDTDCREVLEATNWDVEAALVPLFNKNEENKQKARKDKEGEIKKKRVAEAKRQSDNLMQIFHTIPNEEIQRLLDENEGDIEETTNMLLEVVAKQEEEKAKRKQAEEKRMREEQDKRLRELKLQALEEKFDYLSEHEVVTILDENNWDIKKAHFELVKLVSTKKRNHVKNVFPSLKQEQIEAALELHDWDIVKTTQYLSDQLRDKKAPVVVKVNQQNLLERSIVMGKKIEEEVAASHLENERNLKEEGIATFKRDLEHIMKTQIRNPVAPGMTPHPLPKQIDEMLSKKKPIEENEIPQPPMPQQDSRILEDKPIGDNSKYSLILSAPENVDIGNTVTVTWEFTNGESTPNDWIGLFPVDQNNKNYLTYQWRGKTDTTKGSVTFTAPNFYGVYDFRYFIGKSYQHIAISNKVRVGPKVDLEASFSENKSKIIGKWNQVSGNKYSRAWVGLYEKSQTNNKLYLQWDYATGSEISFTCPIKPQEYELRFFTNSYEDVARSNSVRVEGEDRVSATLENGVIYVKPHIVSADPYSDNVWMGVFFTSEKDNRQFRRYKYITDRDAEVRFKSPRTPGEYEVRLFANKTYDVIVKSSSFNIVKQ